jgi:predicted phage baseplate assembly protein
MSLPSPNLDDRKFQDIVDDAKRMIGRRCPEWTDHNVSDPGVTLIELFSMMTEMMLYRLNQVPEKNYRKFLEMIGISLESPAAAQTDLRFRLSRAIEDEPGQEAFEQILRARSTVAATVRTETQEAIEFSTDADLRLVRPKLTHILATPGGYDDEDESFKRIRPFSSKSGAFAIYSPRPIEGDCVYFGFEADVSGNTVELKVDSVQAAATGLNEDYPAQAWEYWNGIESRWDSVIDDVVDTSLGFNQPLGKTYQDMPTGLIQITLPYNLTARQIDGKSAYWLRVRYSTYLPPRGPEALMPDPYLKSPEVRSFVARVIGGNAPASNCITIANKVLGQSDGLPGQVFKLPHAPILNLRNEEVILIGEEGVDFSEWQTWTPIDDFADSLETDRHFVIDTLTGEVLFGPSIPEPNGKSVRQYGAVPSKGLTVLINHYRYGGGTDGNVAPNQIRVLKSSIPYIADVTNVRRADGGQSQETLERAKMRGRSVLRIRDRAVTADDFAYLAGRASSGVGRAWSVQPRRIHTVGESGENIPAGTIRVLIVPAISSAVEVPRPRDLVVTERIRRDVEDYLDERRLLTTVLEVTEPTYVFVSTDIELIADPKADKDRVRRAVQERLNRYINPLTGGPDGTGWPFRQPLTLSDIYVQLQAAHGVAFLRDVKIYVSRVIDPREGLLSAEQLVSNRDGVIVGENELLCTREHRIIARPIWEA